MPKAPRRKKPKRERINPDKFKNAQRPKDVVLPRFELQNVVATFNLGVDHLDLRAIALKKPFTSFPITFLNSSGNGFSIWDASPAILTRERPKELEPPALRNTS